MLMPQVTTIRFMVMAKKQRQPWERIKQAAVAKPGPYLIHQESDVIIRAIRDHLRQDISEVLIDEEAAFKRAQHYISQVRPDFVERLKLYQDKLPLFNRFQIEQQIESAYQREVRLPSCGSLVIDHSEALVAIDINSARATRGRSIEETALQINLEAAEEIARQLRIRDIGGLVVIDFIDMTPIRNQREVETCLRNALRQDRARIQIGRISRFGLLEMSRQRLRASLNKASQITCPRCNGQGTIRSIESLGFSMIHLIQEQAAKAKNLHFQIQLPVDTATYLVNEKRKLLNEIEQQYQVKITIIPNEHMESPHYQLKQIKIDPLLLEHDKGTPSYRLAKSLRSDDIKKPVIPTTAEPIIHQFLTTAPPLPTSRTQTNTGLFKRLMSKMFGSETQSLSQPTKPLEKRSDSPDQRPQTHEEGFQRRQYSGPRRQSSHPSQSRTRTRRGSRGGQRSGGGGRSSYHSPRGNPPPHSRYKKNTSGPQDMGTAFHEQGPSEYLPPSMIEPSIAPREDENMEFP